MLLPDSSRASFSFTAPCNIAYDSILQIEAVIVNPSQREAMDTHVDQLLRAVLMQMRMNFSTPLTDASTPETLKEVH